MDNQIKEDLLKVLQECERFSNGVPPMTRYIKQARDYLRKGEEIPDNLWEDIAIDLYERMPPHDLNKLEKDYLWKDVATRAYLIVHILNRWVKNYLSLSHLAVLIESNYFDKEIGWDVGPYVKLKYMDNDVLEL